MRIGYTVSDPIDTASGGPLNPRLIAVAGPLSGGSWSLDREKLTIGRHASNDVQVREPEVSRHHCVISRDGGRFLLLFLQPDLRAGSQLSGDPRSGDRVIRTQAHDYPVHNGLPPGRAHRGASSSMRQATPRKVNKASMGTSASRKSS